MCIGSTVAAAAYEMMIVYFCWIIGSGDCDGDSQSVGQTMSVHLKRSSWKGIFQRKKKDAIHLSGFNFNTATNKVQSGYKIQVKGTPCLI